MTICRINRRIVVALWPKANEKRCSIIYLWQQGGRLLCDNLSCLTCTPTTYSERHLYWQVLSAEHTVRDEGCGGTLLCPHLRRTIAGISHNSTYCIYIQLLLGARIFQRHCAASIFKTTCLPFLRCIITEVDKSQWIRNKLSHLDKIAYL